MTPAVFVYGTLMPAQPRWPALRPFTVGAPVADRVRGVLVDTGHGYPGLVEVGQRGWVHGWRVDLLPATAAAAWSALDTIEGVASGLYRRTEVVTAAGVGCATYVYLRPTAGLRRVTGRWR